MPPKKKTEENQEEVVFTNVALGVAVDKDGRWGLVRIPFNHLTNEVGEIKFEVTGNNKNEASERFKIVGYQESILG